MPDIPWERDLTLLVVWTLVISSMIQGTVHLTTAWVLYHQESETDVGTALNKRELSLGIKNIFRTGFDLLLAIVVTWNFLYLEPELRLTLYFLTSVVAFVAIYFGVRFVIQLRHESWGQPGPLVMETTNARQDEREVFQDQVDVRQQRTDERQDEREAAIDDRS